MSTEQQMTSPPDSSLDAFPRYAPRGNAVVKLTATIMLVVTLWFICILAASQSDEFPAFVVPIAVMPALLGALVFRYMRPFVTVGTVHYGRVFSIDPRSITYEKRMRYGRKGPIVRIETSRSMTVVGAYGDWTILDVAGQRHTLPKFYRLGGEPVELVVEGGRARLKKSPNFYGGGELLPSFHRSH